MDPLYFVHISDSHIGPTADYQRHGHRALPCAQRVVELINSLPTRPEFVIHTGDVVTAPHPDSYALAAEVFAALDVPIYYATGNHDTSRDIHTYLNLGDREDFQSDEDVLSYAFECKGERFVALDGRAPDGLDPHGLLSDAQLDVLRREATPDGPPLTVITHFPALPLNSPWMDANMLMINGEEMHRTLLPARDRLRGVFYGHIHQARHSVRDGITYVAAASTVGQFTSWPTDERVVSDREAAAGYSFVQYVNGQVIVQHQTFERPE
ncbi:MAG: metallophosphoesterase [Chloroflexota bacterium]